MTEDTRNQTRATMYLACATNKGNVRNCEECANRDDCTLKEDNKSSRVKRRVEEINTELKIINNMDIKLLSNINREQMKSRVGKLQNELLGLIVEVI